MIAEGHQPGMMHSLSTHKTLTKKCNSIFKNSPKIWLLPCSHPWLMIQFSCPKFRPPFNHKEVMVQWDHIIIPLRVFLFTVIEVCYLSCVFFLSLNRRDLCSRNIGEESTHDRGHYMNALLVMHSCFFYIKNILCDYMI